MDLKPLTTLHRFTFIHHFATTISNKPSSITMVDRTVLVTGATGLLGREVAKAFRLKSWNVKGTGLSRADGVDILKVDLSSENEVKKVLEEVK